MNNPVNKKKAPKTKSKGADIKRTKLADFNPQKVTDEEIEKNRIPAYTAIL